MKKKYNLPCQTSKKIRPNRDNLSRINRELPDIIKAENKLLRNCKPIDLSEHTQRERDYGYR